MNNTTDLWFASFLNLKGHEVVEWSVREKRRGVFSFDIPDEDWKELKLEFSRSDISKVKYYQERLKDLVY